MSGIFLASTWPARSQGPADSSEARKPACTRARAVRCIKRPQEARVGMPIKDAVIAVGGMPFPGAHSLDAMSFRAASCSSDNVVVSPPRASAGEAIALELCVGASRCLCVPTPRPTLERRVVCHSSFAPRDSSSPENTVSVTMVNQSTRIHRRPVSWELGPKQSGRSRDRRTASQQA